MTTYLVRDYDEAIAYFTKTLGFALLEDTVLSPKKRWVRVSPSKGGAALLLAKASTETQISTIGLQAGGRVAFFLYTDAFDDDFARMKTAGVEFVEEPRQETYGKVVVFKDLYGHKWDFIERV